MDYGSDYTRISQGRVITTILYMYILFLSCACHHLTHTRSDADSDPSPVAAANVDAAAGQSAIELSQPAAGQPAVQWSQTAAAEDVATSRDAGGATHPESETLTAREHVAVPPGTIDNVEDGSETGTNAHVVHTDGAAGEHGIDPPHGSTSNTVGQQEDTSNTDQHASGDTHDTMAQTDVAHGSEGGHGSTVNTDIHAVPVAADEPINVGHVPTTHTNVQTGNVATTSESGDATANTVEQTVPVDKPSNSGPASITRTSIQTGNVATGGNGDTNSHTPIGDPTNTHSVAITATRSEPAVQPTTGHSDPHIEPTVVNNVAVAESTAAQNVEPTATVAHTSVDTTHKDNLNANTDTTGNAGSANGDTAAVAGTDTNVNGGTHSQGSTNVEQPDPSPEATVGNGNGVADQTDNDVTTPEEEEILDMFMGDVAYHRFPQAMSIYDFKTKVLGKTYKKLYILETGTDKLFSMVRQLEVTYSLKDNMLYARFIFRFIYSRRCSEVKEYRMGKLIGDKKFATFEKGTKDGKTERLIFFSNHPSSYVYLMSCTDMKTSPTACKDTYYLSLSSSRDPPNQFPWLLAATELKAKMGLTFDDPRFMFNFVMTPCPRRQK